LADDGIDSGVNRADDRPQLAEVLALVKDLSGLIHSDSTADLFGQSFHTLLKAIPFDVGVAVMLEQNLDLYISARPGAGRLVGQPLIERVRGVLKGVIPAQFTNTEIMVRDERHNLDADPDSQPGLDHDVCSILRQENRTAGVLLVCRAGAAFDDDEQRVIEIFSAQLSMLLENLRARQKIISLADTDELTGIPNRRFFRKQLTSEMGRSRVYNVPLSLLLIDVDNFKEINDRFGHPMGDVVLSELCGAIHEILRSPDDVSRFGGDEFAVILPHTDAGGAAAVADRILKRVQDLSILSPEDDATIHCTVSIGIAQCESSDATFSDIVRRADDRLYDAKREGKNRYNY
jgi:diguanylate cyclase (GGDEF)-like protein